MISKRTISPLTATTAVAATTVIAIDQIQTLSAVSVQPGDITYVLDDAPISWISHPLPPDSHLAGQLSQSGVNYSFDQHHTYRVVDHYYTYVGPCYNSKGCGSDVVGNTIYTRDYTANWPTIDGKQTVHYHIDDGQVAVDDKGNNLNSAAASGFKNFLLIISPFFLAFGWVNFFESARRFFKAENKNYEKLMDLGVSFVSALGTTLVFALTLAAVAGFIYAAPYVLAAVLGLNTLRCLYYTLKSLKQAYQAPDQQQGIKHLKAAGLHFLGIITNVLAFVAGLFLFQAVQLKMNNTVETSQLSLDSATAVNPNNYGNSITSYLQDTIVNKSNMLANAGLNLALASLALAIPGLLMAAWRINKESLALIKGHTKEWPKTFEGQAWNRMKSIVELIKDTRVSLLKRGIAVLASPLIFSVYGLAGLGHALLLRPFSAAVLGLPQVFCHFAARVIKKYFPPRLKEKAALALGLQSTTAATVRQLQSRTQRVKDGIAKKIADDHISRNCTTAGKQKKREGQIFLLKGVLEVLNEHQGAPNDSRFKNCHSIDEVEEIARQSGYKNVYQNFWKAQNTTQSLAEEARQLVSLRSACTRK